MLLNKKILESITFFILVSYALYLCYINNYGWDWDTYAMFETFINIKENGNYTKSRGAGYLIPEIGLGFLAYNFGSNVSNIVTFIFLIISLIFFYKAMTKIINSDVSKPTNLLLFLILCLSNHIIIRDSTIPMDYSWSFMFYSIGLYTLVIRKYEISILFFTLCFGSRFNFIVFIIPTIYFIDNKFINLEKKIYNIFIIIFLGCLFYIPSWLQSQFSLDFIYSEQADFKTNPILSIEEISRFSYKVLKTFGIFSILFIFYHFFKLRYKLLHNKFFLIIIFFNLLVFFIFPWEPSFLWLTLTTVFFIIVQKINIKLVYFLVFLNLFNWFYQFELVYIKYDVANCYRTPIDAIIKPHFSKGLVLNTKIRLMDVLCYPDLLGPDKKIINLKNKIVNGEKLN